MEHVDSTVISTSLPAIAADIGTDPIALKLALTAYLVALAIFIPISGWMSDRYGARNVFRLAILAFVLGSIGCAFSNSLHTFVASRFFQGMGASMMTPVGRLLLVRTTPRNELVSAMAWLTIPALIGPMVGPPIGGALTTWLSWHWIFWVNVPIGLLGVALATRFLPAAVEPDPRPIDAVGFLLCAVAFSGLVFGLSVISLPAVPIMYGYITLGLGVVAGILYLFHVRRTAHPLLDPALLRHRLFRATLIGGSLFRIAHGAIPFLLPLMLQLGFGLSPFESGMITFVSAVGAFASKFMARRVFAAFGFRTALSVAAVGSCAFVALNGFYTAATSTWLIMTTLLLGGLLRSIMFTGSNALAYGDIEDSNVSQATALNAVFQQLTVALAVAVAGGILEVSSALRGGELALADFHIAFFTIAAIGAFAAVPFLMLPHNAGSDMSGHGPASQTANP